MATRQEIVYVIRSDGTVEEQVTGVAGPTCETVTAAVEEALGEVIKREKSSDYYDQQADQAAAVEKG